MEPAAVIHLKEPDELSLENAYRSLPRRGEVTIDISLSRLNDLLELAEKAGFAGMTISTFRSTEERVLVRAFKGKQGICYNTGRTARYQGGALAALDDDHHLLMHGIDLPVCEKTAILYSLPSYRDLIHCTEADRELLDKLNTDPERFEGESLDASLETLYAMTRNTSVPGNFTDLFYPGPFRILILEDGTIVRRGLVNRIRARISNKLIKSDGLFAVTGLAGSTTESFPELYMNEGPRSLFKRSGENQVILAERDSDLSSLRGIPGDLRTRIINTIRNGKDYFMLTGSNREDQFGCCPSDEVTGADQLVRAGILCARREPEGADTCPLTIYAFRKEMSIENGDLHFSPDHAFRQEVLSRMVNDTTRILKIAARWILLLFVALSVILSIYRFTGPLSPPQDISLYEQLDLEGYKGTAVVLFHYTKRCTQCMAMEKFTREVLNDEFQDMVDNNQIFYRELEIDRPENRSLVEELGIFTSTLVIIRFGGPENERIRVLDRSWKLYDNETEFKQMLTNELQQMIREEDE
jgi:hypothetical protein